MKIAPGGVNRTRSTEEEQRPGDGAVAPDELVTVAIPARNEEQSLASCLRSVLDQDYRNLQVLVVDGASVDRTPEIVIEYAERDDRVTLVRTTHRNAQRSLNQAIAAARGRWFVRVDAHATVPPDYVRRAVEHLQTGRWGGVGGRKDGVGETAAGRAIAAVMASRFGVGNSLYHHGTQTEVVDHIPFGSYPTELLRELGGWDEVLVANEDFELDLRIRKAGHQLLFDPRMTIAWQCRQSVGALFSQYRRYGRGKAGVAQRHPSSMSLRHCLPPAAVACWAAAAVVRKPALTRIVSAPYVAALLLATAVTARKMDDDAGVKARIPLAFVAMHVGWGLGFWQGLVTGNSRPTYVEARSERLSSAQG